LQQQQQLLYVVVDDISMFIGAFIVITATFAIHNFNLMLKVVFVDVDDDDDIGFFIATTTTTKATTLCCMMIIMLIDAFIAINETFGIHIFMLLSVLT